MAINKTECDNALVNRMLLSTGQSATITATLVLLTMIIVFINGTLAYAMYKCNLLKSRGNFYLFLLTLSDGLYAISAHPLLLILYTKYKKERNCSLELAACFMGQCVFNVSTYLITLIAFHRYLKIDPSMKNLSYEGLKHSAMSGRIANFLVVCCFVIPIAHGFISTPFFGRKLFSVATAVIKVINITVFLTICALYVKVYYRFSTSRKQFRSKRRKGGSLRQHSRPYQAEFMKTVLLILISLTVTVLPYFLFDAWTSYYTYITGKPKPLTLQFAFYLSQITISLNCFLDAIIVIYRNRIVKTFIRSNVRLTIPWKARISNELALKSKDCGKAANYKGVLHRNQPRHQSPLVIQNNIALVNGACKEVKC